MHCANQPKQAKRSGKQISHIYKKSNLYRTTSLDGQRRKRCTLLSLLQTKGCLHKGCFNRDDRIVDFYYPILSCFWKMISVSDPNPVLIETILSVSENYPKTIRKCIVMHNIHFLCCVYFASWGKIALWGKITASVILPLAEHKWLKWWNDKFGTHVLLSWPWHL